MRESVHEIEMRLDEQGISMYSSIGHEKASKEIAERLEQIQKLYGEVIVLANNNDVRVYHNLEFPEGVASGQNYSMKGQVYWNPSSARC